LVVPSVELAEEERELVQEKNNLVDAGLSKTLVELFQFLRVINSKARV